jgi:hypothetical protein
VIAARPSRARRARGLTLVELVVAAGLLTILIVALLRMLDDFLSLWQRSELRRRTAEEASGIAELLAADLASLEGGSRGDLLAEWAFFDGDGDGTAETKWPRVRLVRHASPRELALHQAGRTSAGRDQGLLEVVWTVLPARSAPRESDLRAEGVLWRGERLYGSDEDVSIFDPAFLSAAGRPSPNAIEEVSGGVLWLGMQFARPTTLLYDGWRLGDQLEAALPAWDAWGRARANAERHVWNQAAAGLPQPAGRPVLPRRARLEIELEQERDLVRRTRLVRPVEPTEGSFPVEDMRRIPSEPGAHVLIDSEWMRVRSISGGVVSVERAQRGTQPAAHARGALVHFGATLVREVPLPSAREDWAR